MSIVSRMVGLAGFKQDKYEPKTLTRDIGC